MAEINKWLLCLGAKKAGTSAIFHYLKQHPKVQPCQVKEPLFFTRDYEYRQGMSYYQSMFPKRRKDSVLFEASAQYLTGDPTPVRVKKNLGMDVKFIVSLREPIERLLSQYAFDRNHHGKYFGSFNSIAKEFLKSKKKNRLPYSYMFLKSVYSTAFENWLKHYPLKKFIIVDSRDLKQDPNREANRIFKFAGLKQHDITDTRPIHKTNYLPEDKIDPEVYRGLDKYYSNYDQKLYKILGRNLQWRIK